MQQVKQWFHNYLGTLNLEALFSSFLSKSFQVIFTIILLWLIRQIITRLASLIFIKRNVSPHTGVVKKRWNL